MSVHLKSIPSAAIHPTFQQYLTMFLKMKTSYARFSCALASGFLMLNVMGQSANVTFQVDMNEQIVLGPMYLTGTHIDGWCGTCVEMTDADGDGIYVATVNLDVGNHEYKFNNGGWEGTEYFAPNEGPCTQTTVDGPNTFVNRLFSLDLAVDTVLPAVCFESCFVCASAVVFHEDFSNGFSGNNGFGPIIIEDSSPGNTIWQYVDDAGNGVYQNGSPSGVQPPAGEFSANIGELASTTSSNGWMIFDADYYNTPISAGVEDVEGYLYLPDLDFSSMSSVVLEWEQYFRYCCYPFTPIFVQVSSDGGASWSTYEAQQDFIPAANSGSVNPQQAVLDISCDAALQSDVSIRFAFLQNPQTGGGYSHYYWGLDDITIHANPIEYGVVVEHLFLGDTYNEFAYSMVPLSLAASAEEGGLDAQVWLSNVGAQDLNDLTIGILVLDGSGDPVFSYTTPAYELPSAANSLVCPPAEDFWIDIETGWVPDGLGTYTVIATVNAANLPAAETAVEEITFTNCRFGHDDPNALDVQLDPRQDEGATDFEPTGYGSRYTISGPVTVYGVEVAFGIDLADGIPFEVRWIEQDPAVGLTDSPFIAQSWVTNSDWSSTSEDPVFTILPFDDPIEVAGSSFGLDPGFFAIALITDSYQAQPLTVLGNGDADFDDSTIIYGQSGIGSFVWFTSQPDVPAIRLLTCPPADLTSDCYGSGMFESEDFECYAAGDLIGQSNVHWNTWTAGQEGLDMDVLVQESSNGTQALHVEQTLPEGGVDDVILHTDRTTGNWSLTWDMFLAPSHSAYFNLQGTDAPGSTDASWQLNALLSADGSLALDGPWGAVQTAIGASAGEWFEFRLLCSMETGLMKLLANGEEVLAPATMAGHMAWINFFGLGDGTTTGDYWVDNVVCQPFEPLGCTDSGAPNYTADALIDDGSCITATEGECAELFISEYVEGWSNNKAIEIYNPTSYPIDMSNYRLERYSNGATSAQDNQKVDLMGTVMPGDVLVYVLDKQDPDGVDFEAPVWDDLAAAADFWLCPIYEENNMMYFNGNDALVLRKISTNTPIDIFGVIGDDPGAAGWDGITQNHTLVRRPEILQGDLEAFDAFDVLAVWDSLPANTFDQLGFHSCFCTGVIDPEAGCTDPNALNYNPQASVDDGSCTYLNLSCASIGTAAFDDAEFGFYPPQSIGVVGVPYSHSMALHVPDLITEEGTGTTYSVTTFIPDSWSGEVPGLVTPSVPDALDANEQLCLDMEGLPEQAGVFAMTLSGELFISVFGTSFSAGTFSVTHVVVVEENPNPISGCTYSGASNYSVLANDDDGSCLIEGCTDPVASNYHPIFNADNGSCLYGCDGGVDPSSDICNSDINDDLIVSVADLIILLGTFGLICSP